MGASAETARCHAADAENFMRFADGETYPNDIGQEDVDRYVLSLKDDSPRTQARRISSMRVWWKWMIEKRYIPPNSSPWESVKRPSVSGLANSGGITEEMVLAVPVAGFVGIRDRAIVQVSHLTGARAPALQEMMLADVREADRELLIRGELHQGLDVGWQPISDYLDARRIQLGKNHLFHLWLSNSRRTQDGPLSHAYISRVLLEARNRVKKSKE